MLKFDVINILVVILNICILNQHYSPFYLVIDVQSRIILYKPAIKGPRHDLKFTTPSARAIKNTKNNTTY